VLIVCSGSADNFNLEDFYGAGYLVSLFAQQGQEPNSPTPPSPPSCCYEHCEAGECLRRARVGRMMLERRLEHEVDFAAQKSCFDVVPLLQDGALRPI
jgi:2-phosphosulfolactate phosphatase